MGENYNGTRKGTRKRRIPFKRRIMSLSLMIKPIDSREETKKKVCGTCRFFNPNSYSMAQKAMGFCGLTSETMGLENQCDKWQPRYSWLQLHPKTQGVIIFIGSGVFTILGYLLSKI